MNVFFYSTTLVFMTSYFFSFSYGKGELSHQLRIVAGFIQLFHLWVLIAALTYPSSPEYTDYSGSLIISFPNELILRIFQPFYMILSLFAIFLPIFNLRNPNKSYTKRRIFIFWVLLAKVFIDANQLVIVGNPNILFELMENAYINLSLDHFLWIQFGLLPAYQPLYISAILICGILLYVAESKNKTFPFFHSQTL